MGNIGLENGELMWREIVGKEMGKIGKENGELMWRKKWGILVWRTGS